MSRPALGVIALLLLVAGIIGSFTNLAGDDSLWWGGVALRSGALLGVFWLVLPKARVVPKPVWVGLAVFAVVVAMRPRLALLGLAGAFVAMVVVAMTQQRSR